MKSLPREEEDALWQMLDGVHRFLRYLQRDRFGGPTGEEAEAGGS